MPCPTCTETLQCVASDEARQIHWCPRCGTLQVSHYRNGTELLHTDEGQPKLVERVRTLIAFSHREPEQYARLHRLGILEGALPPDQRPPG